MATSKSDMKKRITKSQHEILSYKPGKAVPCDDELVVFPDQLVIGLIQADLLLTSPFTIVPALRRALHGDVEAIKYADRRKTSAKGQEEYLTDSILFIERTYNLFALEQLENVVNDLAAKVECFVVVTEPRNSVSSREAARKIKEITGCYPIVGLWNFSEKDVELERKRMREKGIVEVHEIPKSAQSLCDTEQLQLLNLLHGCLREGDVMLANVQPPMNPKYSLLYERAKKEITGAKQKMTEEIRRRERVEESLQKEVKTLQMKLEESSANRECLVNDIARLNNEIVREKQKREQAELAMSENDKMARNSQEMYKQREAELEEELKTKERHIKAQEDKCKEREEMTRRKVERIKKENEEEREHVEQLERETWTLRTKIQLESEIRSAEKKKKSETSQWMKGFIPWIASSGEQARSARMTSSENNSNEVFYPSQSGDKFQSESELPNDEFADILKQIADDLYDEAKIDSLGSQLGILQGDIQRALMTNVRFNRVTSEGTRHMLQQWREGVSSKDERIELRRALEAAKLLDLADHYLPQEGPSGSEHPRKVKASHRLSGEKGTASKQGFAEENTPSGDAAEVTRTDDPNKLDDRQGQSGKDGPPLAQGSLRSRGRTDVEKTIATIEHSSPGDTSYMNEEENEGANQQSEESSNHSTTEDMPSGVMFSEETSTSNENQIEYTTTKFDDLVSSLVFCDAYLEKLYFLLFAKVIIDIRYKVLWM